MKIFIDESGDLGWTLDQPFRAGGSSRYLTIAFLFLPQQNRGPKRIIKKLYKKYGWQKEKKASDASDAQKMEFCKGAVKLLADPNGITVECMTVKKINVQEHIRQDANKLYNYVCGLVIPQKLKAVARCLIVPDVRSIKVESQNSLGDYLQTKVWFEYLLSTTLLFEPAESKNNYYLQFVDWIAHCIWCHYEDNRSNFFEILKPVLRFKELYFSEILAAETQPV